MNYLKKLMCFGLVVVMTCTTGLPVYASNNKEISAMTGEISALTGEITNIETPTDSTINYTEQRQDGLYYITENVNGNEKICRNISRKFSLYARLMSYKSMNFSKWANTI